MTAFTKGILIGSLMTLLSGQVHAQYPQQQDNSSSLITSSMPREASLADKIIVYGSAGYVCYKYPETAINAQIHEGTHALTAWLLGVKIDEYSPLPLVFSDRLFK